MKNKLTIVCSVGGVATAIILSACGGGPTCGAPAVLIDGTCEVPCASIDACAGNGDAVAEGAGDTPDNAMEASADVGDAEPMDVVEVAVTEVAETGVPDTCSSARCDGGCVDLTSDPANCGACGNACTAGMNCVASACAVVPAPRLIAPMSTSTVTSQTPRMHWQLGAGTTGAHVEVCSDRPCAHVEQGFDATDGSGVVATRLAAGVHFWHARAATGSAYSATWEFWVGARSAAVDTSWGATPDVNGDGYADVVVGAPGTPSTGAVYVYTGSAAGASATPTILLGPAVATSFGYGITCAGDVNGDGFADLVIVGGALGGTFVCLGGAAGLSSTSVSMMSSSGLVAPLAVGDVNGDGYADLLSGGDLYLGSSSGPSATPTTITGASGTFAGAGDVNGDGFADVIVGELSSGAAQIYLGSPAGLAASSSAITAPAGSMMFGNGVGGVDDVNGDGLADVYVDNFGAVGSTPTAIYTFAGSATSSWRLLSTTTAPSSGAPHFGAGGVSRAGDVNGDGLADVVVGDPEGPSAGHAFMYLGSTSGLVAAPITLMSPASSDGPAFCNVLAAGGDVNGDTYADLAIGSGSSSAANVAWVFFGGASGPGLVVATLNAPAGSGSFGWRVAVLEHTGRALASSDPG